MIPAALFAVTATTASAFSGDFLRRLDVPLSEHQISALEEAQELRHSGDLRAARERLEAADISIEDMYDLHKAVHAKHEHARSAVHAAVQKNDYEAFVVATDGMPVADIIDTEAKFAQFVAAHELREAGDHEAARDILTELGFSPGLGMAKQPDLDHQDHAGHQHGMMMR